MTDYTTPPQNPAETMRDMMKELGQAAPVEPKDVAPLAVAAQLVTIPLGARVEDVSPQVRKAAEASRPMRRKGTAKLTTLGALACWTDRFSGPDTVIFADDEARRLTAITNYHPEGIVEPAEDLKGIGFEAHTAHCDHRGTYACPLSDEWKAWTGISDKLQEKADLGYFLEEHALDVLDPTPALLNRTTKTKPEEWETRLIEVARKIEGRFGQLADLMRMSKEFQVHESTNVTAKYNRNSGETTLDFASEHRGKDGKPLSVPNLFLIAIPVYKGGATYRLPVRFRYRKAGDTLKFALSVLNVDKAERDAFDDVVSKAADFTGVPVFYGTPEG